MALVRNVVVFLSKAGTRISFDMPKLPVQNSSDISESNTRLICTSDDFLHTASDSI